MIASLIAIALAQAAAGAPVAAHEGPVVMNAKQIREYNSTLTRSDPAYIRCERILETGSLVKKMKYCRTNAEWRRLADIGNETARDMQERYIQHSFSISEEPTGG